MASSTPFQHFSGEPATRFTPEAGAVTPRITDPAFLAGLTALGLRRLRCRLRLLLQIEAGVPLPAALRESGLNITLRSAGLLVRNYRGHGLSALVDGRSLSSVPGRNPRTARTPIVENLIRRLLERGLARPRGIQRAIAPICEAHDLPVPSASTIRRVIESVRDTGNDSVEPSISSLIRQAEELVALSSGRLGAKCAWGDERCSTGVESGMRIGGGSAAAGSL